ncbi:MAG TPA: M20/M25/M40 family metallo-hydrolase, partial [Gemmatimonadaceae bacterium]|nr:M20/M25/M40 family metallo-hydrolase [Gemmatimonadaceae bacterium]
MRIASAIGLVLLCALAIVRDGRAPSAVSATAPDTVFSAERAMRHVEQIAARPHPMGTADHDRVRDYIVAQLTALGIRAQIQRATAIGTRYQSVGRVQNILAWMPGSTPNGQAAVLLMAHYDGVGAGAAASDDGAGCAALLETIRALRARGHPLAHDVFIIFTDGEEAGLLGAAAFVREHPWAKDVDVALNFEARGTTGRSFMFETGPGNLDAARVLRHAVDPTAGSIFTTIYRALPNDTDLSELAALGVPALNFAFADGVERYHTSSDDLAHLNPGSLQHHGTQMLALAERFGDGVLPRPKTSDGVFFDVPLLGLVVYPQWLSIPIAILALVLVGRIVWGERSGVAAAALVSTAAMVLSAAVAHVVGHVLDGPAAWSGWYGAGIVLVVLAVIALCRALGSRWSTDRAAYIGTLVVCALLAAAASVAAPGAGYLLVWPVIFAAAAAISSTRWRLWLEWLSAAVTLFLLAGFAYGASVIMLGLAGAGAIVLGVLASITILLLAPLLAIVAGTWANRRLLSAAPAAAAVVVFIVASMAVHVNADHPIPSSLDYVANADSGDAWLGSFGSLNNDWVRKTIGTPAPPPAWLANASGTGRFVGRRVSDVALDEPNATLARDTTINGARRVVLRVTAPAGTTSLLMRAPGTRVLTASIDNRVIDTTRYRFHPRVWTMQYWAPPDTGGAIVAFSIPLG